VCWWRAMSDSGEWIVGLGCGGVGDLGSVGGKKLYYLVAPFEIADFRGE
jgi:hypothetical protein